MSLKEYKRLRFVHLTNIQHMRRVLRHSWLEGDTRAALEFGIRRERGELNALRRRFWDQHTQAVNQAFAS